MEHLGKLSALRQISPPPLESYCSEAGADTERVPLSGDQSAHPVSVNNDNDNVAIADTLH